MNVLYHDAHQLPLFPSKVCSLCNEEKPLDQFSKRRESKDGYRADCKACVKRRNQAYYAANHERLLQQKREYGKAHKEEIKQRNQAWRHAHLEQELQRSQAYRETHREEAKQRSRAWHTAHQEYASQRRRAYYLSHQEQLRQNSRVYYRENKEQIMQTVRLYRATHVHEIRRRASDYQAAHPIEVRQRQRNYIAANRLKFYEHITRRKVRKQGTTVHPVSYNRILERDGRYCYICEQPILSEHAMHFDHVIPLSRGGVHSEDNIKPTHQQCNLRKNNKLLSEMTAHQRRGVH